MKILRFNEERVEVLKSNIKITQNLVHQAEKLEEASDTLVEKMAAEALGELAEKFNEVLMKYLEDLEDED